jgi:predicted RNase H-like HicB family nuclease
MYLCLSTEVREIKRSHLTVLIEQDEDGYYVATVPSLKSCYTQAKTLEELYPRVKEVIELCLEGDYIP